MNFGNFKEIINKKKEDKILLGQMQKIFLFFSFWRGDDGLNSGHKIYHNQISTPRKISVAYYFYVLILFGILFPIFSFYSIELFLVNLHFKKIIMLTTLVRLNENKMRL